MCKTCTCLSRKRKRPRVLSVIGDRTATKGQNARPRTGVASTEVPPPTPPAPPKQKAFLAMALKQYSFISASERSRAQEVLILIQPQWHQNTGISNILYIWAGWEIRLPTTRSDPLELYSRAHAQDKSCSTNNHVFSTRILG